IHLTSVLTVSNSESLVAVASRPLTRRFPAALYAPTDPGEIPPDDDPETRAAGVRRIAEQRPAIDGIEGVALDFSATPVPVDAKNWVIDDRPEDSDANESYPLPLDRPQPAVAPGSDAQSPIHLAPPRKTLLASAPRAPSLPTAPPPSTLGYRDAAVP